MCVRFLVQGRFSFLVFFTLNMIRLQLISRRNLKLNDAPLDTDLIKTQLSINNTRIIVATHSLDVDSTFKSLVKGEHNKSISLFDQSRKANCSRLAGTNNEWDLKNGCSHG